MGDFAKLLSCIGVCYQRGATSSSFIIAVGFDMWHGCVSKYVLFLLLAFTPAVVCPPPHTLFHLVLEYSKLVNDSRQGGRGAQV